MESNIYYYFNMKKEKIISIIGNGEKPDERFKEIILRSNIIITADGGANHSVELEIKPDYIIGDLDSIFPENKQKFCDSKIIRIEEQQTSDLEKALNFAATLSADLIRVFSVFGRRSDHAFYNFLKLWEIGNTQDIEFFDNFGFWKMYAAGQHILNGKPGETISLFTLEKITEFEMSGFGFPVESGNYKTGFFSLSNTFQTEKTKLKFASGKLFVYRLLTDR